MGKGKKKFERKEAEHFYLLHRSQTDAAHQSHERPSDFVLVRAADAPQNKSKTLLSNRVSSAPVVGKKEALRRKGGGVVDVESYFSQQEKEKDTRGRDHINSLGFKNDGYDYSQHLKVMGGGVFVGADGKRQHIQSQVEVDLPPDAVPSGQEFDRQLEAITIDHSCMDDDLHRALFDDDVVFGEGDDCEFEEICDDFVDTVMQEPETRDFDYDQHIADLIARSRNSIEQGVQGPRGWDKRLRDKGKMVSEHDDDSDEIESFNGDEDEKELQRRSDSVGKKPTSQHQQMIEDQFERIIDEYEDDENIGDLEELVMQGGDVGEELCGTIELEDLDSNAMLSEALNDFLQESKDEVLCNGLSDSNYQKGSRHIEQIEKWEPLPEGENEEEIVKRIAELTMELEDPEPEMSEGEFIQQDYLKEKPTEEEWDCETILSTYSCLDNHPAVIGVESSGFGGNGILRKKKKKYKGKHKRVDGDDDISEYDGDSMCGGSTVAGSYQASAYSSISQTAIPGARYFSKGQMKSVGAEKSGNSKKIVLVGKHMLPLGYGIASTSNAKPDGNKESSSGSQDCFTDPNSRRKIVVPIPEIDDEGNNSDSVDEDSKNESDEASKKHKNKVKKRKETAEEKKQRKSVVKEERRKKRMTKKQDKLAYRKEETRQGIITDQHQDIDRISVFKY